MDDNILLCQQVPIFLATHKSPTQHGEFAHIIQDTVTHAKHPFVCHTQGSIGYLTCPLTANFNVVIHRTAILNNVRFKFWVLIDPADDLVMTGAMPYVGKVVAIF